jgi:hypothetical protein
MDGLGQDPDGPLHDRALLLHGRKRNEVLAGRNHGILLGTKRWEP